MQGEGLENLLGLFCFHWGSVFQVHKNVEILEIYLALAQEQ